jgi:uncharacterized protein
MIYLDSSALLKLVVEENQSAGLAHWIFRTVKHIKGQQRTRQVRGGATPRDASMNESCPPRASQLDLLSLTTGLIEEVAEFGEPALDAIHLASALSNHEALTAFVASDRASSTRSR